VNLNDYDWIVINSSAGKDSQAMTHYVCSLAQAQGVKWNKMVMVHCDLGRVEWKGTRELAEAHAKHYGLRFEVVKREQSDLLQQIEARGMSQGNAWCHGQARLHDRIHPAEGPAAGC
jgi:3'-phosphoadenosine 5'-phosphosulfate sulfotransferase (PAPS reductase)/FAD synthetase